MSKATPGPWKARMQYSRGGRELGWMVEHSKGRIGWASLAYADTNEEALPEDPVNAANARLIAAAPELVEALRGIVEFVDGPVKGQRPDVWAKRVDQARAALERVEASNGS